MDVYGALADPVRRRILEMLARRPAPAGAVADSFGQISRPAISRHLRVLREARLVHADVHGRERIYRADVERLDEVETWIAALRPAWEQRFDALETEVHRTRRERERRPPVPPPATRNEEQTT